MSGSCFSESIGKKPEYFKFQSSQNPAGILFHPKAIETLIINAINEKQYNDQDIFFLHERWCCFDVHSKLNSSDKKDILQFINNAIKSTYQLLNNATHIIFTLGAFLDISTY